MKVTELPTEALIPYARNPRKNDPAVDAVAASIKEFGFQQPIVIDRDSVVVVGHTRLKAAQKLGLKTVPVVRADNLTPEQIKAYRILDNKVGEKAKWDFELLSLELSELDLDLEAIKLAFEPAELDLLTNADFNPGALEGGSGEASDQPRGLTVSFEHEAAEIVKRATAIMSPDHPREYAAAIQSICQSFISDNS